MKVTCENCGVSHEQSSWHIRNRKHHFCSRECYQQWRVKRRRVWIQCSYCGKSFRQVASRIKRSDQLFCSKACYSKWQAKNVSLPQQGGTISIECDYCGDVFRRKESAVRQTHNFCSRACYVAWRQGRFVGENSSCWKGGRIPYGEGWTESLRNEIRKRDGFRCRVCGKTAAENGRELDVHHIVPRRNGGLHVADNLLTVCQACHARLDGFCPARAGPES